MSIFIAFCSKYLVGLVVVASAVAIGYDAARRRRLMLTLALALPLGYALARIAGLLYTHPQPFAAEGFSPLIAHDIDNSFPSDHMVIGGVFASVAFLAHPRAGLVLWALALLVGFSRMLAGVHWGIDILAGALLALLSVYGAWRVVRLLRVY